MFAIILLKLLSIFAVSVVSIPRFNRINHNFLLPEPNGPFYGYPYDLDTTWRRLMPFTTAGFCEAGKIYTITSIDDLKRYRTEWECIFNAATAPVKVPEGVLHSRVLSIANTRVFNELVDSVWSGQITRKVSCKENSTTKYIGWNNVLHSPLVPYIATVEPLFLNLAPGEYNDGRPSVVFDYSKEVTKECPEYGTIIEQQAGRSGRSGASLLTTMFPINQMYNVMRHVGTQEDGKIIYIGKTYVTDPFRDDKQAVTVAFFTGLSEDINSLSPNVLISGLPNPPLANSFRFMFPGIHDFYWRMSPLDNFLYEPLHTISRIMATVVKTGRNVFRFGRDLPFGFRKLLRSFRVFDNTFRTSRPYPRSDPDMASKIGNN